MGVYIASFKITGTSPILMNNPEGTLGVAGPAGVGTKPKYIKEEEADIRVYRNADGQPIIRTESFRKAIIAAASGRKIDKKSAPMIVKGSVFTTDTQTLLLDAKTGKPAKGYEIDSRRAVVNKQGVLRHRPRFVGWSCMLDLEVDADFIPHPQPVLELLNIAGKIIGILDYRPQKGGDCGRFTAELVTSSLQTKKAKE